jgi:2-methylcitrate dehydratase PrpD
MADLADRLADFTVGLSPASVPAAVRRAATRCILDVVGVALAGSQTELAGRVRDHAGRTHGAGPCRVLGSAATASALGAALANGAAAHVLDYDDTCYAGIVHGSAAVFPAVLAAGETAGIGGAELLAAVVETDEPGPDVAAILDEIAGLDGTIRARLLYSRR